MSEYLDYIWIVLFKCQKCSVASVEPLLDGFLVKILRVSPVVLFLSSITTLILIPLFNYQADVKGSLGLPHDLIAPL